ncbi:VP4 [Mudjinabarry virus]|nr:VP4 [Mudjinabarry virus]
MAEPHAVLFVTKELVPLLKNSFLPVWELRGNETLNELWMQNGKFASDVYCHGNVNPWTYRQLRAHGFIFISTKKNVTLKDGAINVDIRIPTEVFASNDLKQLETYVGKKRLTLRKQFGNILRRFALAKASVLHGSEAETLNVANPRIHKVRGWVRCPPIYGEFATAPWEVSDDATDEKLVSMLDYFIYSAEEVHYVGCGDLRTLHKYAQRNKKRFSNILWHCYDPIAPADPNINVRVHRTVVKSGSQLMEQMNMLKRVERVLIWDVSSDRGNKSAIEWEQQRSEEDRLGESIAKELEGTFSMALIKHRVPQLVDEYWCSTSILIPQPMAPKDMFELRNVMKLSGFSYVKRDHIERWHEMKIDVRRAQSFCVKYHRTNTGRKLKKMLFEYLHIEQEDGLRAKLDEARADLFYLSNRRNQAFWHCIRDVLKVTQIGTLWVGKRRLFDYDDFVVSRSTVMLQCSYRDVRVFDGNAAVLYLLWKYPEMFDKTWSYDPGWAQNFAVIIHDSCPEPPVPDVSLCRFIGLRLQSSMIRLNSPSAHEMADHLKKIGLDVSGHMMMTLMSDAHVADLYWWIRMILEWSSQDAAGKLGDLHRSKADVIEWKEEMEGKPWHLKNDLISALIEYERFCREGERESINSWIEHLRNL